MGFSFSPRDAMLYMGIPVLIELVPVLIELGKLVNQSVHLYVFKCDLTWIRRRLLLMNGQPLLMKPLLDPVYVLLNNRLYHWAGLYMRLTIEDLLGDRYEVYTDSYKYNAWRKPTYYEGFGNNSFSDNFVKLVTTRLRTWDIKQLMDVFSEVSESPQKFRTFFSNKVLIQDQNWMDVIEPYLPRFMAIHVGQQYLSVPITPLCVGPTFDAQRLYETSLLQYWYHLKSKFYFEMSMNILVNGILTGDQSIYDFYANINEEYNDLYLNDTQSLFVFMIYSLDIN
ncbi:unnamed protein product [Oppiella nova]|uniref:Uncharacterized protein n=1 Tax=Oppiella nova TaxID=334625 RepID=A0A7R9QHP5_9ACAR|nr:unnamed protein product [Oppiella nova]CAG2166181.1 unnamed protein product [Oppiella nova]